MAKMTYKGPVDIADVLLQLGERATGMSKAALYEGNAVILHALEDAVMALPDTTGPKPYEGLLPNDKADMVAGLGVAPFETTGDGVSTHISFDGYTRRTEKKYPNGVPLPMLARSLESGSSVRAKHPFVRPAVNAAKQRCLAAIGAKFDQLVETIIKNH